MKISADNGSIGDMHQYALMLLKGDGIETNVMEGLKYMQMAANNSHPKSIAYILYFCNVLEK